MAIVGNCFKSELMSCAPVQVTGQLQIFFWPQLVWRVNWCSLKSRHCENWPYVGEYRCFSKSESGTDCNLNNIHGQDLFVLAVSLNQDLASERSGNAIQCNGPQLLSKPFSLSAADLAQTWPSSPRQQRSEQVVWGHEILAQESQAKLNSFSPLILSLCSWFRLELAGVILGCTLPWLSKRSICCLSAGHSRPHQSFPCCTAHSFVGSIFHPAHTCSGLQALCDWPRDDRWESCQQATPQLLFSCSPFS